MTAVAEPRRSRIEGSIRSWWGRTFESLVDRNLRILALGTLINFLAIAMSATVQAVVAFDLTGTSRAVGTVMLGQGIALLVISPFGGALADRVSKRTMLVICQAICVVTYGSLAIAVATGVITVAILVAGSFTTSTMFSLIRSVRNAYTGELAPANLRGNAVAVQQLAISVMQILAPLVAGILLSLDFIGATGTYAIMSAAFVVTVLLMFLLPRTVAPPKASKGKAAILAETWDGFRYGWTHPQIQWVLGGFALLTVTGMPYMTLLPGYTLNELDAGTSGLGLLLGISACGGLVVSLLTASLIDSPRAPHLLTACNVCFGFTLLGLAGAPSFALAAVCALLLGAGASGFQVLNLAIALKQASLAYMGRVAALTVMAFSLSGIVALPIGVLADQHGERPLLAFMGIAVLVVSLVLVVWRSRSPIVNPSPG